MFPRNELRRFATALFAVSVIASPAFGQAYKCKTPSGGYQFSDQPCRSPAATAKAVGREHISEEQRRSSSEWLQRGSQRLQQREMMEAEEQAAVAERAAQKRAQMREQQQRQQEAAERQRMADEIQALRREQAETAEAARRAAQAAENAAAAANRGGPTNCKIKSTGQVFCW